MNGLLAIQALCVNLGSVLQKGIYNRGVTFAGSKMKRA